MRSMSAIYTQTLHYGEESIPYTVTPVAGQHTRIRIHVNPAGDVEVQAPESAQAEAIRKAVRAKAQWISQHLREFREHKTHVLPREYVSGESHLYLGRRYMLKVVELDGERFGQSAEKPGVKLSGGKLIVRVRLPKLLRLQEHETAPVLATPLSQTQAQALRSARRQRVKILVRDWYRSHAQVHFDRRLAELQQHIAWLDHVPAYRLQNMRKQWGSCSPSGTLLLNPHVIKAPRRCIDYVLIHELCHLQEHNHSPAFYRLLEACMYDWQEVKGQLDGMAELLLNE